MSEKSIRFEFDHCLIDREQLQQEALGLQSEVEHLARIATNPLCSYKTDYAFMELPFDTDMHTEVMRLAREKRALKPAAVVLVGIGGSNLGVKAVQTALQGILSPEQELLPIFYADTVDPEYIAQIGLVVQQILQTGRPVLVVVSSKSGSTTETALNFDYFLRILQAFYPHDFARYVVVITDSGSVLHAAAQEYHMSTLLIPAKVGGRYSVFSPVGLFPLALIAVSIDQLLAGARSIIAESVQTSIFENMAALRALIIYIHNKQGVHMHDTFLFSVSLQYVGAWYRQLMGESIGKEYGLTGGQVFAGITPTVSMGTVDLHSVAQLYLGGPFDKVTSFVSTKKLQTDLVVPRTGVATKLIGLSQEKSYAGIMDAILQGTKEAYKKSKRPYISLVLPEKSAYTIGQLLQMHMMEMVYLGYLLRINPFDQPNVELYKKEARKLF